MDSKTDFKSIIDPVFAALAVVRALERTDLCPQNRVYRFQLKTDDTDDVVWLTIDGHPVIADPGSTTQVQRGVVALTAGWQRIELGDRHFWGGTGLHLFWQLPGMGLRTGPQQQFETRTRNRAHTAAEIIA